MWFLICLKAVRQEVPRLLGEGGSRGAGDAGTGQRLPPQVLRVRRVRRPPPEGRPVRHQAGTALLQARLREGGRDAPGIRARYCKYFFKLITNKIRYETKINHSSGK